MCSPLSIKRRPRSTTCPDNKKHNNINFELERYVTRTAETDPTEGNIPDVGLSESYEMLQYYSIYLCTKNCQQRCIYPSYKNLN